MPVSSGSVVSVVFNAIFLDATIFGFFKVKFGQCIFLMPLSSVFWRQFCSGQFFCWIDHRVFQFFGVSFVRGIFFSMPLSSDFVVFILYKAVLLVPLSSVFWC